MVEAKGKLLYVDEVNWLDDHIVNIILDVTSTGKLEVQRNGQSIRDDVFFTLAHGIELRSLKNPENLGNAITPSKLCQFALAYNKTRTPATAFYANCSTTRT